MEAIYMHSLSTDLLTQKGLKHTLIYFTPGLPAGLRRMLRVFTS